MKSTNMGDICLFYRLIFLDCFETVLIREVAISGSVSQMAVRAWMETVRMRCSFSFELCIEMCILIKGSN